MLRSEIPIIAANLKPTRSFWCALISIILHSTVLVYFSESDRRSFELPIQVTILPLEEATLHTEAPGGIQSNNKPRKQGGKNIVPKPILKAELHSSENEPASVAPTLPSPVEVSAKPDEANALHDIESGSGEIETSSRGGGKGNAEGVFSGGGLSRGHGHGLSSRPTIIIPARYSDTPRPVYPETARREGREGRVLLHVLIDVQGETKVVEVSRSSGSDALDQAATNAIKSWRFHPARRDDEPVESWVNVPIDFRLTDNKNY